jgi:hypothetical protein
LIAVPVEHEAESLEENDVSLLLLDVLFNLFADLVVRTLNRPVHFVFDFHRFSDVRSVICLISLSYSFVEVPLLSEHLHLDVFSLFSQFDFLDLKLSFKLQ